MDSRASIATSPAPSRFAPLLFAGDVPAAAKAAAELGFDGIEINMKGPEELSEAALRGLLEENGLSLAAVASGRIYVDEQATLSDPDDTRRLRVVDRVKRLIEYAAAFGAPVIVGLLRGERLVEENEARTVGLFAGSMDELAAYAQGAGVELYLEAINRYETPLFNTAQQTVDVIRLSGRPNIKVLLDVFHMNIEEVSIAEAIRTTGALLGHFHVVDSNRRAPGMGHVVFGEIADALRDIGYAGWLSGEHLPLPDSYSAAKQTRAFITGL